MRVCRSHSRTRIHQGQVRTLSCWAAGSLLGAGISYGTSSLQPSTWSWRIPSLLQAAPPLLTVAILFFLPESPRWLAYNDRQDEALAVLAKINGRDQEDPVVQLQYREIIDTLEFEKTDGQSMSFKDMIRSSANRKRLFLALSIAPLAMLTGSNVITYYFGSMFSQAGVTNPTTQLQINVILTAWQLVIAICGPFLADRLGRRLLALLSLGACTDFLYLLAGLTAKFGASNDKSGSYGTVACIFLFPSSYSFGITPITALYAPEVLSYNMRANGIALQGICIKCCGVFVTMVFPFMLEGMGWKTYTVNASWNILFWAYIYYQWVETKGCTLEEIDKLFDGEKHSDVLDLKDLGDTALYGKDLESSVSAQIVQVDHAEKK